MEDKCVIIKESELRKYQDMESQLDKLKDIEKKYDELKEKHPQLTVRFEAYIQDYDNVCGFGRRAEIYSSSFDIVGGKIDIGGSMRSLLYKVVNKLSSQFHSWRDEYIVLEMNKMDNKFKEMKHNHELVKKENRMMKEAIEKHNKKVWFDKNKIVW